MPNKKCVVVTDSGCDLSDALLAQYNIRMIPLRIVYKHGEYRDRMEISSDQVYARLDEEIPKTSLPLPEEVTKVYDELAQEGVTDVLHVCISSGLSGTYNMVRIIASEYEGMNIRALDTKTLSMQEGMIVLECARKLQETGDIDAAYAHGQNLRERSIGMFVIRTLEYLRKGGRIGLVEGVLGNMLQLKPIIFVNEDGVYQTLAKARGMTNAIDNMLREIQNRFKQCKINVSVVHGGVQAEAEKLLQRLSLMMDIGESFVMPISPVLGAHTGPGLLGIIAYAANE